MPYGPMLAQSFARSRGILMVHTFNEGAELPNGKTQQWMITPQDRQPIAIGVICEEWHNGPEILPTFIQVTTAGQRTDLTHHGSHASNLAARYLAHMAG